MTVLSVRVVVLMVVTVVIMVMTVVIMVMTVVIMVMTVVIMVMTVVIMVVTVGVVEQHGTVDRLAVLVDDLDVLEQPVERLALADLGGELADGVLRLVRLADRRCLLADLQ